MGSHDLLMFFNLGLDKRHPGRISGTKPVQIAMFLDRKLYGKTKKFRRTAERQDHIHGRQSRASHAGYNRLVCH